MTKPKAQSFSHLVASKSKAKKADDEASVEDDKKDDKDAATTESEPKEDQEDGKKGKKAKNAEDKKDDETAAAAESEDKDDKEAESDKDEEEAEVDEEKEKAELNSTGNFAAARGRERARCAAIFGSKEAAGKVDTACKLAFHTTLTASEAIGVLSTVTAGSVAGTAPAKISRLDAAMNSAPNTRGVGVDEGKASATEDKVTAGAQRIINAGKLRRGEKI